jgi:hypothetical protein
MPEASCLVVWARDVAVGKYGQQGKAHVLCVTSGVLCVALHPLPPCRTCSTRSRSRLATAAAMTSLN